MPESNIAAVVASRLKVELVALLGAQGPYADGIMQMRQHAPDRVLVLVHLVGGRHAVIGWDADMVTRSLHGKGEAGYLSALAEFCSIAKIPPLDSRLARLTGNAP